MLTTMPTADLRTDAGLASELRAAVMRMRRRLVSERHPDNDLSIGQMVVLGLLVRLGDQTVGDLARAERVQPPSMTRTVNCLEADGYVVRRPHDTDGRQVVVSLDRRGPRRGPGRPAAPRRLAVPAARRPHAGRARRPPRGSADPRPTCPDRLT